MNIWRNNIKIVFKGVDSEDVICLEVVQDRIKWRSVLAISEFLLPEI
jgi:hypothetical protein